MHTKICAYFASHRMDLEGKDDHSDWILFRCILEDILLHTIRCDPSFPPKSIHRMQNLRMHLKAQ